MERASSPDDAGAILSHISNEMVRTQKQFFGKGPEGAKSYFLDDMLVVVMRGGMTTAEETMLRFGHEDLVRRFRQIYQDEMTERLTSLVEQATGRKVATYQSQVMFRPNVIVELFVFEDRGDAPEVEATVQGQLDDARIGEATETDLLEPPSTTAAGDQAER